MGESWIADAIEFGLEDDPMDEYRNTDKTPEKLLSPIEKANKRTELFYNKQASTFKDNFKLIIDEDDRFAIAHRTYSFIRIHKSKNKINKDYYLMIRLSEVDIRYKKRFEYLITEGRLRPQTETYHKDHTITVNGRYEIKENEIIPYTDRLIGYISY